MHILEQIQILLQITNSHSILRRCFVVNGEDDLNVIISTCFGAAVALTISGLTSTYISEVAEKQKDLSDLQEEMLAAPSDTNHARAAKLVPFLMAFSV